MHDHHSTPISEEIIAEFDAIFGLTPSHVHAILSIAPAAADRVDLLDPAGDPIPDPIGHPQAVYDETAQLIQRAIVDRLSELLAITKQAPEPDSAS